MKFVISRISSVAELPNKNLGIVAMDAKGNVHAIELAPAAQEVLKLPFSAKRSELPMFRMHLENGLTLDMPLGRTELQQLAIGLSTLLPWRHTG